MPQSCVQITSLYDIHVHVDVLWHIVDGTYKYMYMYITCADTSLHFIDVTIGELCMLNSALHVSVWHIYTHTHTHTYMYVHVHMYAYMYIHVYIHMYMYMM